MDTEYDAGQRAIKERFFAQFARVGKAVASPKRLEIIDLLCQGEKTVETVARQAGLSVGNASAQLKALREARLVEVRRQGQHAFYRLGSEAVCAFWVTLRLLAEERLAEVQATERLLDPEGVTRMDRAELRRRVARGEVTVIDVRPADEYEAGHIQGARSVPLAELEARLATLPPDQEIVAYCRGPYCVLAVEAVAILRRRGFRATRLRDGVAEWRMAKLPIQLPPRHRRRSRP